MNLIPNDRLRPEDVPPPGADWDRASAFALTFNGYEEWGSRERCMEVAADPDPRSLTDLRTALFIEDRRWKHYGDAPDAGGMARVHALVERIRALVAPNSAEGR